MYGLLSEPLSRRYTVDSSIDWFNWDKIGWKPKLETLLAYKQEEFFPLFNMPPDALFPISIDPYLVLVCFIGLCYEIFMSVNMSELAEWDVLCEGLWVREYMHDLDYKG